MPDNANIFPFLFNRKLSACNFVELQKITKDYKRKEGEYYIYEVRISWNSLISLSVIDDSILPFANRI
jgi:hypothetical protein